ncbi:MAG: carbohydrate kinase family protein [Candidatus Magasanikbacteria bacterium]|nr:carbohydrate kinase family protein [Candidatus Magasanikbacteria bacterium]
MFDITIIGDTTLDIFLMIEDARVLKNTKKGVSQLCVAYADKIPITHMSQSIGGNATNVAMGLKKLGNSTAIVTELGDDINGITILHELTHAGIDTRFVKKLKGKETRYSVVLNFNGERTVLSYYVDRNYRFPKLEKTQWIYYTSLGKSFEKIQTKLLDYLKKHPDTKLAFNPGSYQKKYGLAALKNIFPYLDLIFVNKQEAELFTGTKGDEKKLIHGLHKLGIDIVAMTDGARGSWASKQHGIYHMPKFTVDVVAKTGAGDAYASGFLSAIINGKTLPCAMEWGTANASSLIQEFGAHKGLLSKTGIKQMINTYSKIKPELLSHNTNPQVNLHTNT